MMSNIDVLILFDKNVSTMSLWESLTLQLLTQELVQCLPSLFIINISLHYNVPLSVTLTL